MCGAVKDNFPANAANQRRGFLRSAEKASLGSRLTIDIYSHHEVTLRICTTQNEV